LITSIQLYPWFIAGFQGAGATGIFAACMGVVALANPFFIGIGNYFGPRAANTYAKHGVTELRRIVTKASIVLVFGMGLFCLSILIFGDYFLVLMYGAKYSGFGVIVSILALSTFAWVLAAAAAYGIWAMKRPEVNFIINLVSFIFTVTFGLWFVKKYGPLGAAYGLFIVNLLSSIIRYIFFKRMAGSVLLADIKSL
jgi:O-antigen/teichoic acid export membrane protein